MVDAVPWTQLDTIPVVLITGTNGKTTTARLVARMVQASGRSGDETAAMRSAAPARTRPNSPLRSHGSVGLCAAMRVAACGGGWTRTSEQALRRPMHDPRRPIRAAMPPSLLCSIARRGRGTPAQPPVAQPAQCCSPWHTPQRVAPRSAGRRLEQTRCAAEGRLRGAREAGGPANARQRPEEPGASTTHQTRN